MTMSFAVACKKFFGLLPEQTVGQFVAEVKALTPEDRREMAPLLSVELGEEVLSEITMK